MSDSTPIVNSREIVKYFNINEDEKEQGFSDHHSHDDDNNRETMQSYQEWRDKLMDENDEIYIESSSKGYTENKNKRQKNVKKSPKKCLNGNQLYKNLSPQKSKNSEMLPVLSKSQSGRNPLTSRSSKYNGSAKKNGPKLFKGLSANPEITMKNKLTLNSDINDLHGDAGKLTLTSQNSVLANYELIREVDEGKKEISQKKQRLRDLEEEIVGISEKMINYQNETNEIIEELHERIRVREEINAKIKEEPIFYVTENTLDISPKDEYTSSDELLHMLRYGVDKKFKAFLDS
jgi:hypothetical protein